MASKTHRISITEPEMVRLMHERFVLDLAFGSGWTALIWRCGEAAPPALKRLAQLRGVEMAGTCGDGI